MTQRKPEASGAQATEDGEPPCSLPQTTPRVDGADPNAPGHASSVATPEDPVAPVMLLPIGARIFSAFSELANSGDSEAVAFREHLITESERFTLWAQSLGLNRQGHASLDYRVRDAKVVKGRLADVLEGLRAHLDELCSVVAGVRQPFEREHGEEDSSSASSSQDASNSATSDATSTNSEPSSSASSFHEIDYRQRSITEAIDALYSLATKIRNPQNRPQRATRELYKHIPPQLREQYTREREAAEVMIVSHIQRQSLTSRGGEDGRPPEDEPSGPRGGPAGLSLADVIERYASPSNFLVKRIGIANARRKQQFVYWREHAARIQGGATAHNIKQPDDPKGKGPLLEGDPAVPRSRQEPRATSSAPRQSLATSATKLDEKELVRTDGLQSVISHHNRVSTIVTSQGPKLEWPSPPAHLTASPAKFITCPYCQLLCPRKYLARDAWR